MICIAATGRSQRITIAVYSIPGIPGHDSTYAAMAGIAVYSGGHGKAQWLVLQCTMAGWCCSIQINACINCSRRVVQQAVTCGAVSNDSYWHCRVQ